MSRSDEAWRSDLTAILEELEGDQYKKMLEFLDKIPKCKKNSRNKVKMPGKIIEHYGIPGSISAINDIMSKIPRNDPTIQSLLCPHVEKLRNEQEKDKQGKKRKREEEEEEGVLTDVTPKQFNIQNQLKSSQPNNKKEEGNPTWKKSICEVKSSRILETESFFGKVVQKSRLHPYETKDKRKNSLFFLGVADETASLKVKVYGNDHYKAIKEGSSYIFRRNLFKDDAVVVTNSSIVTETKSVVVPEELEVEARRLIYPESPVCSIEEAKQSADKTDVSVEGTVTEIDLDGKTKVKDNRKKVKRQRFQLKDKTGSIWIFMWDERAIKLISQLSVGDVIQLINMKTNDFHGDVTLNSTGCTRLHQVESVGVQKVRIEIMGIKKATKKETQLDAEIDHQLRTFVVASPLLAKALDVKLPGDFKQSLLNKIPISADAEIRGNKINKMTAAEKM